MSASSLSTAEVLPPASPALNVLLSAERILSFLCTLLPWNLLPLSISRVGNDSILLSNIKKIQLRLMGCEDEGESRGSHPNP
jgi:hypothetical protein